MLKFEYEKLKRQVWDASRKIRLEAEGMRDPKTKALLMQLAGELLAAVVESPRTTDTPESATEVR
jgi:hypothetical protein